MIRSVACITMLSVFAPSLADAKCAFVDAKPVLLTPADTVIEDGGGVIVQATGAPVDGGDVATQSEWRFVDGSKRISPTITRIAPGLVVYQLPATTAQTISLETGKHERLTSVRRSDTRDASRLGAPVIRSVDTSRGEEGRFSSTTTTVHFPTAAPRGAIALVIYSVDATGTRTPRSFGAVRDGDRDVVVFHTGHCSFALPGTAPSMPGDTVAVAWLDRSGRVSEASKPINVVASHEGP